MEILGHSFRRHWPHYGCHVTAKRVYVATRSFLCHGTGRSQAFLRHSVSCKSCLGGVGGCVGAVCAPLPDICVVQTPGRGPRLQCLCYHFNSHFILIRVPFVSDTVSCPPSPSSLSFHISFTVRRHSSRATTYINGLAPRTNRGRTHLIFKAARPRRCSPPRRPTRRH